MSKIRQLPTPFMGDDDVYFVLAPAAGKVKIGVTGDIGRRFREIQLASPIPVELACVVPGAGRGGEMQLHEVFGHLRSHGEWFDVSKEIRQAIILGFIEQIIYVAGWLESLDPGKLEAFLDDTPEAIGWMTNAIEFATRFLAVHGAEIK